MKAYWKGPCFVKHREAALLHRGHFDVASIPTFSIAAKMLFVPEGKALVCEYVSPWDNNWHWNGVAIVDVCRHCNAFLYYPGDPHNPGCTLLGAVKPRGEDIERLVASVHAGAFARDASIMTRDCDLPQTLTESRCAFAVNDAINQTRTSRKAHCK